MLFAGQLHCPAVITMSQSCRVFTDLHYAYFVTWTLVEWIHLFDKEPYRQIILDSLNYLRIEKKTQLNAFVIMSSHLHTVLWPEIGISLSDVTRDFKRFTSRKISQEAEKQGVTDVIKVFKKPERKTARKMYPSIKSGRRDRIPKRSSRKNSLAKKIDYIHMNPVKAGLVKTPEQWQYSSARAYLLGEETYPPTDILLVRG